MRKLNFGILVLLAIAAIQVSSCKKSNTDPDPVTPIPTQSILINKWYIDSTVTKISFAGQVYDQIDTANPGDYIHFINDTMVVYNENNVIDTGTYININDQKIVLDGDTANILTLTNNEFVASVMQSRDTLGITINIDASLYTHR